jgi:hypothetical protein
MTATTSDYLDLVRTAEAIIDAWRDKFRTDCPPSPKTVCFWLEMAPPELVLRGIEHACRGRSPNAYMLADIVKAVDDYIAGPEPP